MENYEKNILPKTEYILEENNTESIIKNKKLKIKKSNHYLTNLDLIKSLKNSKYKIKEKKIKTRKKKKKKIFCKKKKKKKR